MNSTKASMNITINEESNRTQLRIAAKCGSQGRLLTKNCLVDGFEGDHQKIYKPLEVGEGLRLQNTGVGDNEEIALPTDGTASGDLILDDGANWRVTLSFTEGVLDSAPVIGASVGAIAAWTPDP